MFGPRQESANGSGEPDSQVALLLRAEALSQLFAAAAFHNLIGYGEFPNDSLPPAEVRELPLGRFFQQVNRILREGVQWTACELGSRWDEDEGESRGAGEVTDRRASKMLDALVRSSLPFVPFATPTPANIYVNCPFDLVVFISITSPT